MYILSHIGDDPDESFTVTLDSVEYKIRMKWNTYDEAWRIYIGYSGQDEARVKKAVVGTPLFIGDHHLNGIPEGEIMLFDYSKAFGRAGRDDTGYQKRFRLIYMSQDEYSEFLDVLA